MAYVYRRRKAKLWTVYYYDKTAQKIVSLPRAETPEEIYEMTKKEADKWLNENWAARRGLAVHKAMRYHLREKDELKILWEDFQRTWKTFRSSDEQTIEYRHEQFERYILPFFVGKKGEKNVRKWRHYIIDYTTWLLTETGLQNGPSQKKMIWMLRRFGEFLVAKGVLDYPWVVLVPAKNEKRKTPLTTPLNPETVLKTAKGFLPDNPDLALALLLGYFGSLGPGEVYGLKRSDFITGEEAIANAKTYEGFLLHERHFAKHGLTSKLAVYVQRQVVSRIVEIEIKNSKGKIVKQKKVKRSQEKYPKNDYRREVVLIWHPEAAKLIGSILKEAPRGKLFQYSRDHLDRLHRVHIKSKLNATAHDLRRASALYLGRKVRLPLELLQRHLRHSQLSTTELYIREPERDKEIIIEGQDFDDVA